MQQSTKNTLAITGWLATALLLFWLAFFNPLVLFGKTLELSQKNTEATLQSFDDFIQELTNSPEGIVTTVHWLNPACNCFKYSENYLKKLMNTELAGSAERKNNKQTSLAYFIVPPNSKVSLLADFKVKDHVRFIELTGEQYQQSQRYISSSPGVSINSIDGGFAYLGPHSSGLFCGSGKSLTRLVIENIEQGFNPKWINDQVLGCFCRW